MVDQYVQPPEVSSAPPSADGEELEDPLLSCLARVADWHGVEFSPEVVLAGLPVDGSGRLTVRIFEKAAHAAGFKIQVVRRKLRKLARPILPAILLLKDDNVGVLLPGRAGDIEFEAMDGSGRVFAGNARALRKAYSGYAILLRRHDDFTSVAGAAGEIDHAAQRRRWFWSTLWRFRADYLRLLPASFLVNLFAFALPFFTMLVYNRVVPNSAEETLWVLATGVGAIFAFEYIMRLMRGYVLKESGREMDRVLASDLFLQILSLEMRVRPPSSGMLAGRAKSYEVLRDFFVSASILALADVPFAILMTAATFFLGGQVIGWLMVASISLTIFFQLLIQPALRRSVVDGSESGLERQTLVSETVNGMETVKASNAEGALLAKFERAVTESSRKEVRAHWYSLLGDSTTKAIINVTSIAIIVASVYQIQKGEMSLGGMIACVMLGSRIMTPLAMAAGLMTRLQQALHALGGLNTMMALPRETAEERMFIQKRSFRPTYEFHHVSLAYPGQSVPSLADLTLSISQGERVALLGRMGSGKSTLLRLMTKIYEPTSGEITLDGISMPQYHPAVVREHVGYLPQNAAIFCGTLKDNITLGARGITDEQVMDVVQMVGLASFVVRNSAGIHAQVGEQGSLLSGGQRQALSLARVLVRRPKMLLLDEPTASLDLQAEQQFMNCLSNYLAGDATRTLVVATHKSSLLKIATRIIILHEGRIHHDGPAEGAIEHLQQKSRPQHPLAAQPQVHASRV
ncbi:ATP-binding cassette subfamily C protein LapB [Roseimicrobium gellanilyticum]|uniref:ATP-binding cassette subfamily C protein LapB n=1 Tax=Roseimicrobium gellanilyticum TaxID=748857 RepID=A0A366HQU4_9BACT|nr:type I secretion system permease/ATPase [Roseimicrobium gellanilyticum]RBP46030.1 ATP-binding cassette subfamily C protein LapB [Roseimicrobium gellanilyticum]